MPISNPGSVSVSTAQPFNTATNASVALTANTAVQVLAANVNRKYVGIVNNSAFDVTLCLGGTTTSGTTTGVTLNQGIILKGGGGGFESIPPALYTGQISAICASAASLAVVEGS